MLWHEERTALESRLSTGGFLSWTFRGFETYVLIVALGPILETLISPTAASSFSLYAGIALGVTLLGWAIGGVIRGFTVRFVGRRNTATYSVLGYSILMGLTALSRSFLVFIALRLLTGILLGTEGERETVFRSWTHPDDHRTDGTGSVYAGFGVGIVLASVAWFGLQSLTPHLLSGYLGTEPWRYLFALGIVPAVFVLYLRRTAEPSARELDEARTTTGDDAEERGVTTENPTSKTLSEVLGHSQLRRRLAVGVALTFVATAGLWGIAAWIPMYANNIAVVFGLANPDRWGAIAGVCYGIGAIAGYVTIEPIGNRIGRLGSLLVMLIGSFAAVPGLYLLVRTPYLLLVVVGIVGYFTLGQFGWLHVYLSTLFPDSAREPALGTVYTLARLAAVVVPILAGYEIMTFEAITTVVATFGILYGAGVLVVLFLPRSVDEHGADLTAESN